MATLNEWREGSKRSIEDVRIHESAKEVGQGEGPGSEADQKLHTYLS